MAIFIFFLLLPVLQGRPTQPPQNYRIGVPRFKTFEKSTHEVYLGDKIRLSCFALATPKPSAHWFRNGEPVDFSTGHLRENEDEMTLEIKKVEVSDQGLWSCKVSNYIGSISRNFTIEIVDFCDYFTNYGLPQSSIPLECICLWRRSNLMRPDLDYTIATQEICAKYSTSIARQLKRPLKKFPCYDPPCDEYGRPLPRPARPRARLHEHVIEKTDEADEQDDGLAVLDNGNTRFHEQYNAYFSNFSSATEVEQAILTPAPEVAPSFKIGDDQNRTIISPAGRTIRLSCKASGYPEPKVVWHKNKIKAILMPDSPRIGGSEFKIRKWTLEMEDTTEYDSGFYFCDVWNSHGSVIKTFNVTIINRMRSPPFIVPNVLLSQIVYVNTTATFHCKVISDLVPHIMWVRVERGDDGKLFYYNATAEEQMFRYTEMDRLTAGGHVRIIKSKDESTLILENVSVQDQGTYACIAGNSLGTSIANATLQVQDFHSIEIATGHVEPEYSIWNMVLLVLIVVMLSVLLGLCASYFTCISYVRRKRQEDQAALLTKRKKIVVHKKQREDDAWSDLPSSYKITIEAGSSIVKKGRRPRLSSDMTLLDDYEVDTDPRWEIERKRLEILEEIGSGAFGEVCKARLHPDKKGRDREVIPVAVKKVKPCATERDLVALVGEMEMFKTIGVHENVLRLVGCCTGVGPLYVILELCEHGNLRDFLRAHRPKEEKKSPATNENGPIEYLAPKKSSSSQVLIENLTQRHLVEFAWQVAQGMAYMASKKIVHRDLAARNVLVAKDFVMKISDFGLSRDVHYRDYYRKRGRERIPYKWMAIESLDENQISTIESDVWSFGILLWEIMTLGGTPYPTIAMQQLYDCLKAGYRMEAPHNCPDEIYRLMTACWQERREKRPSFNTIVDFLEWMLSDGKTGDFEDYSPCSADSFDEFEKDDGQSNPSDEEQSSAAKRRHRPLSAPVNLPSDPQHDICDEEELEELPDEDAPMLEETDSLLPSSQTHYSVPQKIFRQYTDPTSETKDDPYLQQRRISSIIAPSVDSAIGSPAWHLLDSSYSIPIDQSKTAPYYVNIGSSELNKTKFPFPPSRYSHGSLSENVVSILFSGKTNQGYLSSPLSNSLEKEDLHRRQSEESSCSSGRGQSTESEEKVLRNYTTITDSPLPLRRLGDQKKSDNEQRRNAVGNLVQKLSDNI